MKKLKIILLIMCSSNLIYSQNNIDSILLDSSYNKLIDSDNSFSLDSIIICNAELDSILHTIAINISEKSLLGSFYIIFAKQENVICFEIIGDISNNEVFKQKKYIQLIGYTSINDRDFYFMLMPILFKDNELDDLIKKSNNHVVIHKKTIPNDIYIKLENPMWLYSYNGKKIILLQSVNTPAWQRL